MKKKENILQYIFSIIICTLLITSNYSSLIPGVPLSLLLLIISILVILVLKFKVLKVDNKTLVAFAFLALLSNCISFIMQNTSINIIVGFRIVKAAIHFIAALLFIKVVDKSKFLKTYKYVVYFCVAFLYLQTIFYSFNIYLSIKILPLPFYDEQFVHIPYLKDFFRPSSFFSEPSNFAKFVVPALLLCVFGWDKNEKTDFLLLTFIFVSLVLSTSTLGIVSGLIGVTIAFCVKKRTNIKSIVFSLAFIGLVFFALINIWPEVYYHSISKLDFQNADTNSSEAMRILRGPAMYFQLPLKYKIIGIGQGNLSYFTLNHLLGSEYATTNMTLDLLDYASGLSQIFLFYGLFLGTFYVFALYKFAKGKKSKCMLFVYFIMMSASAIFLDSSFVLYITLILSLNINKTEQEIIINKNDN